MDTRPDPLQDIRHLAAPVPSRDDRRVAREQLLRVARYQLVVRKDTVQWWHQPVRWMGGLCQAIFELIVDASYYERASQQRRLIRPFGEHAFPMWGFYPLHYKSVCEI